MNNVKGKLPNRRQIIGLAAAAMSLPTLAQTSSFPQRPVRIVVPYTTGGSNDVIARLLAQQLQEAWGQPVVVENKPGAAGNIGASDIAKSAPDGHSLLLTNINIVSMNPGLIANMPFDPQKDFAPISLLGTTALALVVHPSVPANNVRELIDPQRPQQCRHAQGISHRHAQQHQHHKTANENQCIHDQIASADVGPSWSKTTTARSCAGPQNNTSSTNTKVKSAPNGTGK